MNNASILSLNGKEVTMVAYAANRAEEVRGTINVSFDKEPTMAMSEDDVVKLLSRLRVCAADIVCFPVIYRRTGYYSPKEGYHMDIRISVDENPSHWMVISKGGLKSAGRPFEVDYVKGEGFDALVIPVAKAENILAGRLGRGWDPLLV